MKPTASQALVLSLTAVAFLAGRATSDPDPQEPDPAVQAAISPGKMHEKLEPMVGRWDAEITSWMMGSAQKSKGTMTSSWVLGKRFVKQEFQGDFGGAAFEGLGFLGYDNVGKVFQSVWMDNMGTRITWGPMNLQPDGKSIAGTVELANPMTGTFTQVKDVFEVVGPNEHTFTRYAEGDKKLLEAVYKRK